MKFLDSFNKDTPDHNIIWTVIKRTRIRTNKTHPIHDSRTRVVYTNEEKANSIADNFEETFNTLLDARLGEEIKPTLRNNSILSQIYNDELQQLLQQLNPYETPGTEIIRNRDHSAIFLDVKQVVDRV